MKLLSFSRLGRMGLGAVVKDGVADLSSAFGPGSTSLRELLFAGKLKAARAALEGRSAAFAMSDVIFCLSYLMLAKFSALP